MRLIVGTVRDPALEHLFLFGGQLLGCDRRGHELLGIMGVDPGEQLARFGIAGSDGAGLDRRIATIQSQVGLAGGAIGPMAGETVLGQDRPDVAVVFQSRSIGGECRA